jgi:hypothetical protein
MRGHLRYEDRPSYVPSRISRVGLHQRQTEFQQCIERDGVAVVPSGLPEQELAQLTAGLVTLAANHDRGARGGLRDAFCLLPAARPRLLPPSTIEV